MSRPKDNAGQLKGKLRSTQTQLCSVRREYAIACDVLMRIMERSEKEGKITHDDVLEIVAEGQGAQGAGGPQAGAKAGTEEGRPQRGAESRAGAQA